MTNFRLVQANCYARRYDEAVRAARIAIELTPDSPYTYFYLALSLAVLGSNEEAWEMASLGRKLAGGMPLGEGYFGYLAAVLGHTPRRCASPRRSRWLRRRGASSLRHSQETTSSGLRMIGSFLGTLGAGIMSAHQARRISNSFGESIT